jgi:hypothetical protein
MRAPYTEESFDWKKSRRTSRAARGSRRFEDWSCAARTRPIQTGLVAWPSRTWMPRRTASVSARGDSASNPGAPFYMKADQLCRRTTAEGVSSSRLFLRSRLGPDVH